MKQLNEGGYSVGNVIKDIDWLSTSDGLGYKSSIYHLLSKEDIIKDCY